MLFKENIFFAEQKQSVPMSNSNLAILALFMMHFCFADVSSGTLWIKTSAKITVCHTISEINKCFTFSAEIQDGYQNCVTMIF